MKVKGTTKRTKLKRAIKLLIKNYEGILKGEKTTLPNQCPLCEVVGIDCTKCVWTKRSGHTCYNSPLYTQILQNNIDLNASLYSLRTGGTATRKQNSVWARFAVFRLKRWLWEIEFEERKRNGN